MCSLISSPAAQGFSAHRTLESSKFFLIEAGWFFAERRDSAIADEFQS